MANAIEREQMNVVIVGHVDHGKSTLVGRLLADTGALPEGKLEAVKANCARNAKPFEYAFLLDALKDEQSQGITIDTARCFFKSAKRDYIIIDAPGHIEFLKNMISGAARAEAAMLVIDAKEGIRENSKRHGYMMSFLGIKNVTVCVNKMDLVGYSEQAFNTIRAEYINFLKEINIVPINFIPISAREGDNFTGPSSHMPWYRGKSILEALDAFSKAAPSHEKDLRFPLQDIYKFTAQGDDRRIFSGRIESGTVHVGDEIIFLPSNKRSKVMSIESFNTPQKALAFAGQSAGLCLETQIYVRPGEVMCRAGQKLPHVSSKFKANIFWMAKQPLVKNKKYKLKIATQHVPVVLKEIISVLDASDLSSINKDQVDRHDVSECIFETLKPIAFDEIAQISATGRFVIVDNYEIAGGGIILAPVFEEGTSLDQHIKLREYAWDRSSITPEKRSGKFRHKPALVIVTGQAEIGKEGLAKALEEKLFNGGQHAYYLGVSNRVLFEGTATNDRTMARVEYIRQIGETAHVLTDAGLILITSISDIDEHELEMLKTLNRPSKTIVINVGQAQFVSQKVDLSLESVDPLERAVEKVDAYLQTALELDPEFSI